MRLSIFFLLTAASAFLAPAALAEPRLVYDAPIQWSITESTPEKEIYETSYDRSQCLVVAVRSVDTGGLGAEEWAMAEADRMRSEQGRKLGRPQEENFGEAHWVYLDWVDVEGRDRGRQYFLEGEGRSLAEVSIYARDEVFLRADASQFDGFLASFRFEEES